MTTENKLKTTAMITLAGIAMLTATVQGADLPKVERKPLFHDAFVNATWKSQYIGQRGFTMTKTPVLQTDVGFSIGKFNYDCWADYDINREKVNEVDNSLSISFDLGKPLRLDAQAIHFTSPSKDFADALELGLGLKTKTLPVQLGFYAGQIVGEGSEYGQVYNFSVAKSFKLSERATLSFDSKLWFNDHYYTRGAGLSHASANATLSYNLGRGFSIAPFVSVQKSIESFGGTFKDRVTGGIGLTKKF